MKFGAEWRCGNCGKIYSTLELIGLEMVKAVESDTDPDNQHGYTSVCACGYRFHLDKFRIHDILKIKIDDKEIDVLISTVDLELNHGFFDKDLWYETGIFIEDNEDIDTMIYENRYETKEEAIAGHNRILGDIEMITKLIKDLRKMTDDEYSERGIGTDTPLTLDV